MKQEGSDVGGVHAVVWSNNNNNTCLCVCMCGGGVFVYLFSCVCFFMCVFFPRTQLCLCGGTWGPSIHVHDAAAVLACSTLYMFISFIGTSLLFVCVRVHGVYQTYPGGL